MFNVKEVNAKEIVAGDAIVLLINQKYKALFDNKVQTVELVELFDVLTATHMKLSKTVTFEVQPEAQPNQPQKEPVVYSVPADTKLLKIVFQKEEPKK